MAIEVGDIKANGEYYEAAFNARLTKKLREEGFSLQQNGRSFELNGFSEKMKTGLSRRTAQIEAKADELNITNPETKAELGAKTAEKKRQDLTMGGLRE